VRAFLEHRQSIEAAWRAVDRQVVSKELLPFSGALPQQPRVGGSPGGAIVSSMDELYEAAAVGKAELQGILERIVGRPGFEGAYLKLAPLKSRVRAAEKAADDYSHRAPPNFSWLYDIARASVICETEEAIVGVVNGLRESREE
jgi:hypothetical protein